jgi:uncharacterized protein YjdB
MKGIGAIVCSTLAICLVVSGCGGSHKNTQNSSGGTKTLSSITVFGANAVHSIQAGATLQLTAKGNYSDGTIADITSQVTWSSSNSAVGTLSTAGMLTSYKPGSVIATATQSGVSGTLIVTVNGLSKITVSAPNPSISSGATEQLTATGVYSDGSTQPFTSQVAWQSSDSTIAVISSSGVVTGLKAGNVTVTATYNSLSGTAGVTVSGPSLTSITVSPLVFSIASGQSKQLSALGTYSDGTSQDVTSQATWTSSAAAATVNAAGLVTGASAGTSTVTATVGAKSGSAAVTVSSALLQAIHVTPATATIATGQTQAFAASGTLSDGSQTDVTDSVVWASNTVGVASVDPNGLASGLSSGAASISATSGSSTPGLASLTVTPAVLTELDIAPDAQYIPIGGQYQLSLTGTYSDGSTQDVTANATWSSSDSTLASVDPATGIVTGVANSNGSAVTITGPVGSISNTTTVYITDAVPVSVQLTPATTSIANGTTQQYAVNVVYSDGSLQPVSAGLSWLSSSSSIAGINSNGLATGLAPGQTTISVFYDSLSAKASLTVTPAVLTNIVVTPATTVVGINGNVQFTATGVFSDSSTQDLSSQVAWSSANGACAVINATGLVNGISAGTVTISATSGTISGLATLNVTTATLQSIRVLPDSPIVPPHSRTQLTAIGHFSDGSESVLSGVSWRSSAPQYAMISSSGVLRTKNAKSKAVTITAKLNGVSGTTSATITSMTIQSLAIHPANPTMAAGTKLQLSLIGTFSDGTTQVDLTASARWQTSSYADAVIDRQGIATGVAAGSVTVTGGVNSLGSASTTLTVTNASIQSIAVTPANPTIALGSSQQFAASGSFSDGSTQDITNVVKWTSSSPTVAVVNQSGSAASASHGTTNINAALSGITGSTLLTVN